MSLYLLPEELQSEIWKKLPIEDILNLCDTNKDSRELCETEHLWKYLLERDYDITYKGLDPKTKYVQEYTKKKIQNTGLQLLIEREDNSILMAVICRDDEELLKMMFQQYTENRLNSSILEEYIRNYEEENNIEIMTEQDIFDFYSTYRDKLFIEDTSIDGIKVAKSKRIKGRIVSY